MKKILSIIGGLFKEDSPISAARIGFYTLIIYGSWMGHRMFEAGRTGLEIAGVLGACFTAATALKVVSKKFEVTGYSSERYMRRNDRDEPL